MKIAMHNPHTGGAGEIEVDQLGDALADGLVAQQDIEMFNPATGGTGVVPAAKLAEAAKDGLVPVGSRAHKVANTGYLETAARGVAQGGSFGLFDEAQALVRAPFSEKTYEQLRDEYREGDHIAEEANPKTFVGSQLGAGIASSFIPGLGAIGAVKKGAMLGDVVKAGAAAGALSGFGASEGDSAGQIAADTLTGGAMGGAMGGAGRLLGSAASRVKEEVGDAIGNAFDPVMQRGIALGAKTKELTDMVTAQAGSKPEKSKFIRTMQYLNDKLRLFDGNPDGEELMQRMANTKEIAGAEMDQAVAQARGVIAGSTQDIFNYAAAGKQPLATRLEEVMKSAAFDEAPLANGAAMEVVQRIENTGGDIHKLWEVKKQFGDHARKAWAKPFAERSPRDAIYIEANDHLDDIVTDFADRIAAKKGIPGLSEANAKYEAVSTWEKLLAKNEGAKKWQATSMGLRFRDAVAGSTATGALLGLGVPPEVAFPLGTVGAGMHGVWRSPQARLARARVGEFFQKQQTAQAAASGGVPRTAQAIQGWIQQNLPNMGQMVPPQVAERLQDIAAATPEVAGQKIRSLMADTTMRGLIGMVSQQFAPSMFKTEVDGKVSSMEDKHQATQMLQKLPLPPTQIAMKISELNRNGTLPPEIFTPPEYENHIEAFNQRISQMEP